MIDRLCKRLGYPMRCQRSGSMRVLEVRSRWQRKHRDGQPEGGFLIGWPGNYRRVWLARYSIPISDAQTCSDENVLGQIIRAIDELAQLDEQRPMTAHDELST